MEDTGIGKKEETITWLRKVMEVVDNNYVARKKVGVILVKYDYFFGK